MIGSGTREARTVCFDLDGTLCTNTFGDYEAAEPFPWAIDRVNALAREGHRIVVFTARGTATGIDWKDVTRGQLARWGVHCDELRLGKPSADVYVDDRAVRTDAWRAGDAFAVPGLGLPAPEGAEVVPAPPAPWVGAVVESGRTFGGRPFLLDAHVERLRAVAARAGLSAPAAGELGATVQAALAKAPSAGSELVFSVSLASSPDAAQLDALDGPLPPPLRAEARPLAEAAAALTPLLADGGPALAAATDRGPRDARWPLRRAAGGSLADGLGGRLAIARAGTVTLAPEPGHPSVLAGWLPELAREAGVELREAELDEEALRGADETFVAAMPFGLLAVATLDDEPLPAGGQARSALAAAWDDRVGVDVARQLATLTRSDGA